jgi:hypothetical protein
MAAIGVSRSSSYINFLALTPERGVGHCADPVEGFMSPLATDLRPSDNHMCQSRSRERSFDSNVVIRSSDSVSPSTFLVIASQ